MNFPRDLAIGDLVRHLRGGVDASHLIVIRLEEDVIVAASEYDTTYAKAGSEMHFERDTGQELGFPPGSSILLESWS